AHAGRLRIHPVHRRARGKPVSNPSSAPAQTPATRSQTLRNRYGFGVGTIGRDAAYTMISMFLLFYLSDILEVSTPVFAAITIVLVVVRAIDAIVDPFVGVLVDNTRSRFGKFKPWIIAGILASSSLMVVLFTPWAIGDAAFIAVFTVVY